MRAASSVLLLLAAAAGAQPMSMARSPALLGRLHIGQATSPNLLFAATATAGTSSGVVLSPKVFYTFPDQAAGTTSAPATVTLTNSESVSVIISKIQLSPPFSQTNTCIPSGRTTGTVPAGGSCAIRITYSPTAVGYSSVPLTITDNATNSPQKLSINGNSYAPLTFMPKAYPLYFSAQMVGRTSSPQLITVTNNESGSITLKSIAVAGKEFSATNNCGTSLAGKTSCKISVYFNPQGTGNRSGSITVTDNAFGSPHVLALTGLGIAGENGVRVTVNPIGPCVLPSHPQQFSARVENTSNTAVNWYVDNVLGGDSTRGKISSSGSYTPPANTGTHIIKAVSQAATSVSGQSTIAVTTSPTFAISPSTASVPLSAQQNFQGQICNAPDANNVTYSVDNIAGGNSSVGIINSNGVYTAPATPGQHMVRATDTSLNKTSAATVTVFSNVVVDFGSRTNKAHPIRAELFGANHVDSMRTTADMKLVGGAVTTSRTYALIPVVYATRTPDWTKIDSVVSALRAAGIRPMLEMAFTPSWLQPNPNPCGSGNPAAVPTDLSQWAHIAASYVAHMDATFPYFVQDYEIWNEPNAGGLCGSKLSNYLSVYAAAAPAMKHQAAADGKSIRVGGPALAGLNSMWISTLLSDTSTAPYVDFISYHQYLFGPTNLEATWDSYNGSKSIYQRLQEPGDGAAALFSQAAALTKNGKQPLGANTPIYVDEYNENYSFHQSCCQNDPVYSPVFNALYVTDVLNTVYTGTQAVPGKLVYFAANAYPYFCLVGTWDAHMDCQYSTGSTPVPYPQYYLYQMLSSPNYLGLKAGGYMAVSVSPSVSAAGLAVTGFYNTTQDSILITNPTVKSYSQINVSARNVGFTSPHAVLYQIVNGKSISQSSLPLTRSSDGKAYTAIISLPAHSVFAIAVQGP
jgi:hypothetical protein